MHLAVKAKALGRRLLDEPETLVTTDTLRAWHPKLIATKCTCARKEPDQPRVAHEATIKIQRRADCSMCKGR